MLISVNELTSTPQLEADGSRGREWLIHEILQSLSGIPEDTLEGIKMKGELNLQLMIDGVVVEPVMLTNMYEQIESYIDREAALLLERKIEGKLEEIDEKFRTTFEPLEEMLGLTKAKIKADFGIIEHEEF